MEKRIETFDVKKWKVFGRNTFPPPFKVSDALINEARIVYVVQGMSRLHTANKYYTLKSGDLLIMKTDNFINNWHKSNQNEFCQIIAFQFTTEFLNDLYNNELPKWFTKDEGECQSVEFVNPSPLIEAYFTTLQHYIDSPNQLSEEIIQVKIRELISLLVQNDKTGSIRKIFGNLFTATDYSFKEVIQNNLYEDLNLEDLAFLIGLSLSSFKRKFSKIYGTTPNKYIVSKRLEKAQSLLNSTALNIAEIAYECGFSDLGYFSKTFRKYYNISPTDFRSSVPS